MEKEDHVLSFSFSKSGGQKVNRFLKTKAKQNKKDECSSSCITGCYADLWSQECVKHTKLTQDTELRSPY